MIKYSDIETVFGNAGITVEEYNIESDDELDTPYIAYICSDGASFEADGINYVKFLNVALVMVDQYMNYPLQVQIEAVLDESGLIYDKSVSFDAEDRLYSVTYNFDVLDEQGNTI